MTTKVLEIRDSYTYIPVLAIRLQAETHVQAYYIHERCGYPRNGCVVLMRLEDCRAADDPFNWTAIIGASHTMPIAYQHISTHFDELADGDVIDVEFLLGKTTVPQTSERFL